MVATYLRNVLRHPSLDDIIRELVRTLQTSRKGAGRSKVCLHGIRPYHPRNGSEGTAHNCAVCRSDVNPTEMASSNPLVEFMPVLDTHGKLKLLRTFRRQAVTQRKYCRSDNRNGT